MDLVEQYRLKRLERLELKKKYDELEAEEKSLKAALIENMKGGVPTPGAILIEKLKPQVVDWAAFYAHIKATGEFELLQRRVTESAWMERWADGVKVPGVIGFPVWDVKVG